AKDIHERRVGRHRSPIRTHELPPLPLLDTLYYDGLFLQELRLRCPRRRHVYRELLVRCRPRAFHQRPELLEVLAHLLPGRSECLLLFREELLCPRGLGPHAGSTPRLTPLR
ncbi:unnamed protein product, partial [Ectocarpus fasciculatus]